MRDHARKCVKVFAFLFGPFKTVLEIGSYRTEEGGGDQVNLRPIFPGAEYIGTDMRAGPGVDLVHNFELDRFEVGVQPDCVLAMETIEHCFDFQAFIREIRRILPDEGMVLLSSHQNFPYHPHPGDYWRFTPEGMTELLERNGLHATVGSNDPTHNPDTVVGLGKKGAPIPQETRIDFLTRCNLRGFRI